MPKVTYVGTDGSERTIDAVVGETVMVTAVKNGVKGIVADCGGNCVCGTCHVWVHEEFLPVVGPPNDEEDELLDLAITERRPTSRLSCQMRVTDEFEGLTVDVPPVQP